MLHSGPKKPLLIIVFSLFVKVTYVKLSFKLSLKFNTKIRMILRFNILRHISEMGSDNKLRVVILVKTKISNQLGFVGKKYIC